MPFKKLLRLIFGRKEPSSFQRLMSFSDLLAQDDDFQLADGTFCMIGGGEFDASKYSDVERPIMLVWHANGIIGNGGFEYLFAGPWRGDPHYTMTVAAHATIGHAKGHEAFLNALSLFPDGRPPLEIEQKHSLYMQVPESKRQAINELYWGWGSTGDDRSVDGLVADYIRDHQTELSHLDDRIA